MYFGDDLRAYYRIKNGRGDRFKVLDVQGWNGSTDMPEDEVNYYIDEKSVSESEFKQAEASLSGNYYTCSYETTMHDINESSIKKYIK